MRPKVSVVMATHHADPEMLRESVECVLGQTFADLEFVIVDDVNGEAATAYLESLADRDSRVRLFKNSNNIGLTASLVRAIAESRGEYVARQDADDVSHPKRLELQVSKLEKEPETILLGTWYCVQSSKLGDIHYHPPDDSDVLKRQLYLTNPFCHASVLFRRTAYDQSGGYDPTFNTTQDLDLWFRMAASGRLGILEKELVIRRLEQTSLTFSRKAWHQVRNSFRCRWRERSAYPGRAGTLIILSASAYHAIITLLPISIGGFFAHLVRRLRGLIRSGGIGAAH